MSRDQEFVARWGTEKPVYLALGSYIVEQFRGKLAPLIAPSTTDYFLKTPVIPRVKDDRGLVQKAFYRGKNYRDPYTDITDKVGVRFVVLLGSDLRRAAEALHAIEGLVLSKDRDYEAEQSKNPLTFDYAAIHYVARPTADVVVGEIVVPSGTPCEVQIKTLLQHAYSELTHDTIYKPQIQATSEMRRNAAKSMALLEATNDYFEKVHDSVAEVIASLSDITLNMSRTYRKYVGLEPSPSVLEGLILEGYGELAQDDYVRQVEELIGKKGYLPDRVKRQLEQGNPVYEQPSIWLVYLDIVRRGKATLDRWRLTPSELEPLMNDLGESVN